MQLYLAAGVLLLLCLGACSGAMNNPERAALRASIARARRNINLDPLEAYLGQLDSRIVALEGNAGGSRCQMGEHNFTVTGKESQVKISFPSAFATKPTVRAVISGITRTADSPPYRGFMLYPVMIRAQSFYLLIRDAESLTQLSYSWIACTRFSNAAGRRAAFGQEEQDEEEEEELETESDQSERFLLDAQ